MLMPYRDVQGPYFWVYLFKNKFLHRCRTDRESFLHDQLAYAYKPNITIENIWKL